MASSASAVSSSVGGSTIMDTVSAKRAMNDLFLSWMSRTDTEAIVQRALLPYLPTSVPTPALSSTSTPLAGPSSPVLTASNGASLPLLSLSSLDSTGTNSNMNGNVTPISERASPKSARARLLDLANVGITPQPDSDASSTAANTATATVASGVTGSGNGNGNGRPKTPISVVITSAPESPPSVDSNAGHVRRGSSPLLGGGHLNISEPHSPIDDHNHGNNGGHNGARPTTPGSPGANLTPRRVPSPSHRLDINRITASPPRSPLVRGRSPIPSPDSKRKPSIAQFYFPGGMPLSPTSERRDLDMISKFFTRTATAKDRENAKKGNAANSGTAAASSSSSSSASSSSSGSAFTFDASSTSSSSSGMVGSSRSISSSSTTPSAHIGLSEEELYPVCSIVCGLSSYCNAALYNKILQYNNIPYDSTAPLPPPPPTHPPGSTTPPSASAVPPPSKPLITESMFLKYWKGELAKRDVATRFFRLLRASPATLPPSAIHRPMTPGGGISALQGPPRSYLTRDDFRPIVQEIVNRHPGLEFLESTPEFQLRYAQTVIARIFYAVNKSGNEQLTLREIKNSNLMNMLQLLDEEDDINKINDYFSYEHFYVVYCKFWELDTDHDGLLDKNDLLKYDDFSLTPAIVDRVLAGCGRRLLSGVPNKMSYADFLVFLISEVDKASEIGLEYWFRVLDLDGDGLLATYELEFFFNQQKTRMQALSQEPVRFPDILCQLTDMVKPEVDGQFTKRDLKRCLMAPMFFNTLFNLNKYIIAEQRDPVRIRQVHATPELSDWDRYAIAGYYRLAECEPEQQQNVGNSMALDNAELDAWNQSAGDQGPINGGNDGADVGAGGVTTGASRAGNHGSIGTRVAADDIDDEHEHEHDGAEGDSDEDGGLFLGVGAAEARK